MELAAILIAFGSLAVAALSLLHTYRSAKGNAQAIRDETDDRREQLQLLRGQVEAEATDRREQLGLLREQVEAEAAARRDERRAYVVASQFASSGAGPYEFGVPDTYEFRVANAGWFPAREVVAVIENEAGEVVGEGRALHLGVSDQATIRVEVEAGALDRPKVSYLTLNWTDATGGVTTKERVLEITPIR
jgi:hypothetical protein